MWYFFLKYLAFNASNFYSHLLQFWTSVGAREQVFLKNGPTPASFSFIFGLFKQTIQFLQQINVKNVMFLQYKALGFEPITSQAWVVSHNH